MGDSTWDAYTADESAAAPEPTVELDVEELQADITPSLDVAQTDAGQGDLATSWGDYNQETANDAAAYAASEVEYAADLYAGGFEGAGDAALNRAQISFDTAASHAETADDYYTSATDVVE